MPSWYLIAELGLYHGVLLGGTNNNISTMPRDFHDAQQLLNVFYHWIQGDMVDPSTTYQHSASYRLGWSNTMGENAPVLRISVKMPGTMGWLQNRLGIPPTSPTSTRGFSPWNKYAVKDCFKKKTWERWCEIALYPSTFLKIIVMFVATLLPGVCHYTCQVFLSVYNHAIVTVY